MTKKSKSTNHPNTKRLLISFVKDVEQCVIFRKGAFPQISEYIRTPKSLITCFEIGVSRSPKGGLYISSFNGGKCYLMEKKLFLSLCKNRNIGITDDLYKRNIICDYGINDLPIPKAAKPRFIPNQHKLLGDLLDVHNTESYMADNAIMAKLTATYSAKDWIETKRSELQMKANVYERNLGAYFVNNNIKFIHQAPFIINKKIYFLDFYLPQKRIAIEVDGISHESIASYEQDTNRDKDFATIGIKTYRINNAQTKNPKDIETFLKGFHII